MKKLLSILLLLACNCQAVQWVIAGAAIETNGWVLRLTNYTAPNLDATTAANTNLQFYNGFLTNYGPSVTNQLVLTLTSMGYDDAGAGIQVGRQVYGTKVLRMNYPMQNTNDIQPLNTTSCVMRLALSDFVFTKDSNITVNVLAGAFASTNGVAVTNCMATNLSVINASSLNYPQVIGNWTWPPYQRIMTNTFYPRAVAFHWSARNGRPVRCVKFIAADTNSVSSTNIQTGMVFSGQSMNDAVPFGEYVGALDMSSMSNGSAIRVDMIAYPWIGDTPLDTTLNTYTGLTPRPAAQTNFLDRLQRYSTFAIVATNGGTGVAGTNGLNDASQPAAFATISAAAVAIKNTNAIIFGGTSWSNLNGGTIYLKDGQHAWTGASATYGNVQNCWLTIASYPTNLSQAIITNSNGDKTLKNLCAFTNIYICGTNAGGFITGADAVWWDNCLLISPTGIQCYQNNLLYITRTQLNDISGNGIRPFATVNCSPALVRGSHFRTNTLGQNNYIYTMVGNSHDITNLMPNSIISNEQAGSTTPQNDGCIIYNNQFTGMRVTANGVSYTAFSSNCQAGIAIVQNLYEWVGTESQPNMWIAADSSLGHMTNALIWNNTIVGQRRNGFYNETGSTPLYRQICVTKNCSFEDDNIKTDTFGTPNAARTGNWSALFGVGSSGGFIGNVAGISASFSHANVGAPVAAGLPGLNTYESLDSTTNVVSIEQFTRRAAFDGSATSAGFGNYRYLSASPLFNFRCEWILPFDIEGAPRSAIDPPGAYSAGNVRKGAFF